MALNKPFHYASVSDIHFFHAKTPTTHILRNLYKAFPDNEATGELDMIFLVGDIFDQITHAADENLHYVRVWANSFLRMCAKRDIVVRMLEGTKKHDRAQPKLFGELVDLAEIPVDFKYFDILDIERNERFGIDILYIPDEWSSGSWASSTPETWRDAKAALAKHGLEKVDFTLIHGAMGYHLPIAKEHLVHIPENYEGITRHQVLMGHIHTPQHRGRTFMNGSFDRLSHGEEHDKGHWRIKALPSLDYHATFYVNKTSAIYRTIPVEGLEMDEIMAKIHEKIGDSPKGSRFRLRAPAGHAIFSGIDTLKKKYPQYHFDTKVDDLDDTTPEQQDQDDEIPEVAVEITRNNVSALVDQKLISMGVDPVFRELCLKQLNEDVYAIGT